MYIVYNYDTGQLQFGFRSLMQCNLQNGILLNNIFYQNFKNEIYYKNKSLYIINNSFFLINEKNKIFKDYRINIKFIFIKKIFIFFMDTLLFFINNKKNIKKYALYLIFFLIILNIFSFKFYYQEKEPEKNKSEYWNYETLISYLKKTKIADELSRNKFDFISLELPLIKGISEFRVIPLNNQSISYSKFTSYLALPYRSIIALNINKSITVKNPISNCDNKKLYFFEINNSDDLLILENKNFTGNNYKFNILKDINLKNSLCQDTLINFIKED